MNLHYEIRICQKIYNKVTMTVYVKCVVRFNVHQTLRGQDEGGGGQKMPKFCPRSYWMTPNRNHFSYTLYRLKSNSSLEFNFRFFFSLQSLEKWNGRLVRTPIQCDLKSHSINMRYLRDSPYGDSVGLQDETRRLLRQPISTPTRFRTSMSNTQHQSCRY